MTQVTFVTGNKNKFHAAQIAFKRAGLQLVQAKFDIDEIQGEDAEKIARDKAHKAYDIMKSPIIVSDDSWSIPGLNGFPGPYMKSMNQWFTPEDFLRLTRDLKDRRIILHQIVIFQDESGQQYFDKQTEGTLLTTVSPYEDEPSSRIKSVTSDGRALAEVRATNPEQLANGRQVWDQVASWIKTRK